MQKLLCGHNIHKKQVKSSTTILLRQTLPKITRTFKVNLITCKNNEIIKDKSSNKLSNDNNNSNNTSILNKIHYNLKNNIDILEQKVLAYYPKTALQMTPFFMQQMDKPPKRYYLISILVIGCIIILFTLRQIIYFGKFKEQHHVYDLRKSSQEGALESLRLVQIASKKLDNIPSLDSIDIEDIIRRLDGNSLNIEIKKETLATILSLLRYESFIIKFTWRRDFLTLIANQLNNDLTREMSTLILQKIFTSNKVLKMLREDCPLNAIETFQLLLDRNEINLASKLLYTFYEGNNDLILSSIKDREIRTMDGKIVNMKGLIREEIDNLREKKFHLEDLMNDNYSESLDENYILSRLKSRASIFPFEIALFYFYCNEMWKKRANAPKTFLKHISKWSILAATIPFISDVFVSLLYQTKGMSNKLERYHKFNNLVEDDNKDYKYLSPFITNALYISTKVLEYGSLLLLWKRAKFIVLPFVLSQIMVFNIYQLIDRETKNKHLVHNLESREENKIHYLKEREERLAMDNKKEE
ncbi:hypothetical protein ABK040_007175 [Willaertia magna]